MINPWRLVNLGIGILCIWSANYAWNHESENNLFWMIWNIIWASINLWEGFWGFVQDITEYYEEPEEELDLNEKGQ